MEETIADPHSWTFLAKNKRACFLEASIRVTYRSVWWVDDEQSATHVPLICAFPRPFRNDMWRCDVLVDMIPLQSLNPGRAAVLVREIPSPLVLTCTLSETCFSVIETTFITLAGKALRHESFPKDNNDFSKDDIIECAEEVVHDQDLLTSDAQTLCIVVQGLPRLLPDGTVLESRPL